MDGVADAPMRGLQGEIGAYTYAVSEFVRVSQEVPPRSVFLRDVPELCDGGVTSSGLPVQVQILGGDPARMARAAVVAYEAGAQAIDINFGCPAPTVNRHDGGATLLKFPKRIREVVAAIRSELPAEVPVSAKLRLGWDSIDSIYENAEMAAEGGAAWLTIHGRTRVAGYAPPAHWGPIGVVREQLGIPVVANGDIWTIEDWRRCRDETGSVHYMIGRGALANPLLSRQIAMELGLCRRPFVDESDTLCDWIPRLYRLNQLIAKFDGDRSRALHRMKQWLSMAARFGKFPAFDEVKRSQSVEELFASLAECARQAA